MIKRLDYRDKDWGRSSYVGNINGVDIWQNHIVQGGKCSIHHHKHVFNQIIVLVGELRIYYFSGDDLINPSYEECLEPSEYVIIQPGVIHQFEVLKDGIITELYWSNTDFDIVRHSA